MKQIYNMIEENNGKSGRKFPAEEEEMGENRQIPRIGDIRKIAEEYFIKHGRRLTFREALLYYQKTDRQEPDLGSIGRPEDFLADDDFRQYIDNGIVFQAEQIIRNGRTPYRA